MTAAVPKPRGRIVDPGALVRFRLLHPWCAVRGCGERAEAHHIIPRGRGGDDVPENLLALSHDCHMAWHTLGPTRWLARYGERLSVADREKIARALT